MGYEANRSRMQHRPESRGGYDRPRDDEQRRYAELERAYSQGRRWEGALDAQRSHARHVGEELERGRFAVDQGWAMPRHGAYGSGEYGSGGSRWSGPGAPEYPGYAGLYSGYGGYGEPGDARRDWQSRDRDPEPWKEGWEADRDRWRGGPSEREAPFGRHDDRHPEPHRHGIAGAIEAIRGELREAFRGLKGYKRSDDRIREDVCDRINELSEQHRMDVGEVEVAVAHGEVTLTGNIDNRQFKHRIENEAAGISGVNNVHNEIRVRRSSLDLEGRSSAASGNIGAGSSHSQTLPSAGTAAAGALSSGMIGMSGTPGTPNMNDRSRTPNGNTQNNR
jgi:hypothetical protein